jgi:hypothetical protein
LSPLNGPDRACRLEDDMFPELFKGQDDRGLTDSVTAC